MQAQTVAENRAALLDLYHATTGSGWETKDGWDSPADYCMWHGVMCTEGTKNVTKLDLRNNNLVGQLPDSIGTLSRLVELFLPTNQLLLGPIPGTVSKLRRLEALDLSFCRFSDAIPDSIGEMTSLKQVKLVGNELIGEIPESFSALANLEHLWLNGNALTKLPSGMSNLGKLLTLRLSNNELTGPFPNLGGVLNAFGSYSGGLTSLKELHLDYNRLSGVIGTDVVNCPQLITLHLNNNMIGGGVPKQIGTLLNLVSLRLQNNNLRGLVPKQLGEPSLSVECSMGGNDFTCPLPAAVTAKSCVKSSECRGLQIGDVDL